MSEIDDGGPAFPGKICTGHFEQGQEEIPIYENPPGMSLRDYFAAKAMQAEIITNFSDATPAANEAFMLGAKKHGHNVLQHLAHNAYLVSDAMIVARKAKS